MGAQRATKVLGIFARLARRDGKPQYIRHQPRVWRNLRRSLSHPTLRRLKTWYEAHVPAPRAGLVWRTARRDLSGDAGVLARQLGVGLEL